MSDAVSLRDHLYNLDSDEADIPFWEATARHEFMVCRCGVCGRSYWPASLCVEHGGKAMSWVKASGRGTVHVAITMHHAFAPNMKDRVPYNVSVIRLEEGPFFHSNVVGCPPEAVQEGMPVEVMFEPHPNGMTLPLFRRVGAK